MKIQNFSSFPSEKRMECINLRAGTLHLHERTNSNICKNHNSTLDFLKHILGSCSRTVKSIEPISAYSALSLNTLVWFGTLILNGILRRLK